jgi:hypothetical protein
MDKTDKVSKAEVGIAAPDTLGKMEESDKIWNEIKDKSINMFALPGQTVKNHVQKLNVPGANGLYVKLSSSAVLASLEETLNGFTVEAAEKYVIIKRKPLEIKIKDE